MKDDEDEEAVMLHIQALAHAGLESRMEMRITKTNELCDCGEPLHYARPQTKAYVEFLIATLGPTQVVTTPDGSWKVPRHYIALHGLTAVELPELAAQYGWEEVSGRTDN